MRKLNPDDDLTSLEVDDTPIWRGALGFGREFMDARLQVPSRLAGFIIWSQDGGKLNSNERAAVVHG